MAITVVLRAIMMARSTTSGYSPLGVLSTNADAAFIATLRRWRRRIQPSFSPADDKQVGRVE